MAERAARLQAFNDLLPTAQAALQQAPGSEISQQAYLKASNTDAYDHFCSSVAVDGDTIVVGALWEDSAATGVDGDQGSNAASQSGAAYVFARSGTTWTQQAYLKASNTDADDHFGCSVAVDGDTIVVGATREDSAATGVNGDQSSNAVDNSGAAYVFTRSGTTWTQQTYLKASNTGKGDIFGFSVAMDSDTIVISARGEDSASTGVNGDQDNEATFTFDSGAAYVFTRSGTTWTQQAYLKASNTDQSDYFGVSVAVESDTIVVGANFEDSAATGVNGDQDNETTLNFNSGAAYVFTRSGTTWTQQAYLKASNTGANDHFGGSATVDGNTIVVGAVWEDSAATGVNGDQDSNAARDSGAVYVFTRSGMTWSQQAYLKASNARADDWFGHYIAIGGSTIVVGAPYENSAATGVDGDQEHNAAPNAGATYVFAPAQPQPEPGPEPEPEPEEGTPVGSAGGTLQRSPWTLYIPPGVLPDSSRVLFDWPFNAAANGETIEAAQITIYGPDGALITSGFNPPLHLCYQYTATELKNAGGNLGNLVIATAPDNADTWQSLPTTPATGGVVCADLYHLSRFALFLPSSLPSTGFAPGQVSQIGLQAIDYFNLAPQGGINLQIPRLGLETAVTGVPRSPEGWDVSWLGGNLGYLEGTAFPTWVGNSVLTGHIYDANGQPGPFVNLHTLWYNDEIIIKAWGQEYVFAVRSVRLVQPDDMSAFQPQEDHAWLTLLTCRSYDEETGSYALRIFVRAVLVEVR